jgi:hypothetical protein
MKLLHWSVMNTSTVIKNSAQLHVSFRDAFLLVHRAVFYVFMQIII